MSSKLFSESACREVTDMHPSKLPHNERLGQHMASAKPLTNPLQLPNHIWPYSMECGGTVRGNIQTGTT